MTSGPGRAPGSDGRARHRRSAVRGRISRDRRAPAEALRRRAELLFPERADGQGESEEARNGPPPREGSAADPEGGADPVPGAESVSGAAGWRVRAGLAVRERLPVWVQTRCGVERRSVIALTALLVVAVAFAAHHYWAGRTQQVPAPQVVRAEAPYRDAPFTGVRDEKGEPGGQPKRAAAASGAAGVAGASGAEIVVDVTGRVRSPGIRRLPAGSRLVDALRAAGGVRPGTDTSGLNRARFLIDGEQVVVGGPAQAPGPAGPGGAAAAEATASAVGPVSLNTATAQQLDSLPGVGPVLAQHIIDYRTRHGGFRSADELRQVNGIGQRRFTDLRDLVRP